MSDIDAPFTAAQIYLTRRSWKVTLAILAVAALALLGIAALVAGGAALARYARAGTPAFASDPAHFMYGSIGAEPHSGLPYWMWKALPGLFPAEFGGRDDYSAFGFLYDTGEDGRPRDLPVGISRRTVQGVDVVWFNCATCHVGTWRDAPGAARHIVPGMPSNNLDLGRFIRFVLDMAADERVGPDILIPAMRRQGAAIGPVDEIVWRALVLPRVREGLVQHRTRLLPLLEGQPDWGPGRVDTFNPYKLLLELPPGARVPDAEAVGTADFPAIFDQRPRIGMALHWDGDNDSLGERNLSAAIGAGVTADSADHPAIERDAAWLLDLKPPPSTNRPDPAAVARGAAVYGRACAGCHGRQEPGGYVFDGAAIGQVTPLAALGTDRNRLDSYTEPFRAWQEATLFAGTRYRFTRFRKTDGYADLPLDGLWLRGPYLHNGSVPTLADLLLPPGLRPKLFRRGSDVVDHERGGFVSPPCVPGDGAPGFCFDTSLRGNGNGGHLYGTDLPADRKDDLLAYLLTF